MYTHYPPHRKTSASGVVQARDMPRHHLLTSCSWALLHHFLSVSSVLHCFLSVWLHLEQSASVYNSYCTETGLNLKDNRFLPYVPMLNTPALLFDQWTQRFAVSELFHNFVPFRALVDYPRNLYLFIELSAGFWLKLQVVLQRVLDSNWLWMRWGKSMSLTRSGSWLPGDKVASAHSTDQPPCCPIRGTHW